MRKRQIVVVDDEQDLREMVADYLGPHGYDVTTAGNAEDLEASLARGLPDLLILDVNMPGENGFSIARRLSGRGEMSILMLTAMGDLVDRVVGLELGADDYIAKPFDLRELRARVNALLRRKTRDEARVTEQPKPAPPRTAVSIGDLALDIDARRLSRADGEPIDLTAMEFDLLAAFASNPNRVLSRDRLLTLTHNDEADVFDRSIDVRVTRLRRKIERDPARPSLIRTMRGAGYMYVPGGA